jgi:hypothetical protein
MPQILVNRSNQGVSGPPKNAEEGMKNFFAPYEKAAGHKLSKEEQLAILKKDGAEHPGRHLTPNGDI